MKKISLIFIKYLIFYRACGVKTSDRLLAFCANFVRTSFATRAVPHRGRAIFEIAHERLRDLIHLGLCFVIDWLARFFRRVFGNWWGCDRRLAR